MLEQTAQAREQLATDHEILDRVQDPGDPSFLGLLGIRFIALVSHLWGTLIGDKKGLPM
jgi:hypothetical protein